MCSTTDRPQQFIGWDVGAADGDATVHGWLVAGHWVVKPDYIPVAWMARIVPQWGPDRDGVMRWHLLWKGWNNGEGHAKVWKNGKGVYCHREVVETVERRKLSRIDHVDHRCERKNCLNYDCLEAVPPGENTRRGRGAQQQFRPAAAYAPLEQSSATHAELPLRHYGDPLDGL